MPKLTKKTVAAYAVALIVVGVCLHISTAATVAVTLGFVAGRNKRVSDAVVSGVRKMLALH